MLDTLGTVSSDMTRERLQTILTSKITELKEDHEHSKAAVSFNQYVSIILCSINIICIVINIL